MVSKESFEGMGAKNPFSFSIFYGFPLLFTAAYLAYKGPDLIIFGSWDSWVGVRHVSGTLLVFPTTQVRIKLTFFRFCHLHFCHSGLFKQPFEVISNLVIIESLTVFIFRCDF